MPEKAIKPSSGETSIKKSPSEIVSTFINKPSGYIDLSLQLMTSPTNAAKVELMTLSVQGLVTAIRDGSITPGTYDRRVSTILDLDDSIDPLTGERNNALILTTLGNLLASENEGEQQVAVDFCSHASDESMIKLGYPNAAFCDPTRFAVYLRNALFEAHNMSRYQGRRDIKWRDEDFLPSLEQARLEYLVKAALERCDEDDIDVQFSDTLLTELVKLDNWESIPSQLVDLCGDNGRDLLAQWQIFLDEDEEYDHTNDEDYDELDLDY